MEGQGDRDEMGICIEPAEYVIGELEGIIERLMTDSTLPPNPDRRSADAWLIAAYQGSWSGSAGSAIIGS